MPTFALVSEGITDQIILEQIIHQFLADRFDNDLDINPLQPLRDATDTAIAAPHGGWELVLEFCEERVMDALSANDYVVIHLDTDQGDHPNFGLHLICQGGDRPYDELVADAIKIIAARVGGQVYAAHVDRLLFAISVHTMESWLLLYFLDRNEPKNSLSRLNRELTRQNKSPLVKEAAHYKRIAGKIKRKRLSALNGTNTSLGMFLERLSAI
ncbi:hypothetical protein ABIG06_006495 [Bradyrhizobium sp. USDA 326]|uniref:hypothetical protein n=1 Tax=unclassified Bradyrhizobium TaxID=2631580 RepID=UPI00351160C3